MDDWTTFESHLAAQLARLGPKGFVTVAPPEPAAAPVAAEPARGLGRLRRRRREPPRSRPLLQVAHDGTTLDAECSGPAGHSSTGFPWTAAQETALVALGWHAPDPLDDWHMYRWRGEEDPRPAARAAALLTATLRDVYGLARPEGVAVLVDELP